jgi:hypothetical protein
MKKKYLPMHLFRFLKEVALLNNKSTLIQYPDGYNSNEILFEGSKQLPRKLKKRLRRLL